MYGIYAYIDPPNHPNVGKYGIHGVSGSYIPTFAVSCVFVRNYRVGRGFVTK